jgi:hypothetical protein
MVLRDRRLSHPGKPSTGVALAFEEYAVRITIDVERRDEHGLAEELRFDVAAFCDGESPAEAALKTARDFPKRVEDRLRVSA